MNHIKQVQRAQKELELLNSGLKWGENTVSKSSVEFLLTVLKGLEWPLTVEGAINATRSGSDSDVGPDGPDPFSDLHG